MPPDEPRCSAAQPCDTQRTTTRVPYEKWPHLGAPRRPHRIATARCPVDTCPRNRAVDGRGGDAADPRTGPDGTSRRSAILLGPQQNANCPTSVGYRV